MKEIGSFLNGKGGILCFGCRSNGRLFCRFHQNCDFAIIYLASITYELQVC